MFNNAAKKHFKIFEKKFTNNYILKRLEFLKHVNKMFLLMS